MKIYGIGIYSLEKQRLKQEPDGFTLHFSEPLKALEAKSLPLLVDLPDTTSNFQNVLLDENEHHYFQVNREHNIIIAICTRRAPQPIDQRELYYLFRHIEFIHLNKASAKTSLKTIIENPFGFTNHDPAVSVVQDLANEVKQRLLDTLPKVLARGEQLEALMQKTDHLQKLSVSFKREAEKTNKCCSIF